MGNRRKEKRKRRKGSGSGEHFSKKARNGGSPKQSEKTEVSLSDTLHSANSVLYGDFEELMAENMENMEVINCELAETSKNDSNSSDQQVLSKEFKQCEKSENQQCR